jgi:hypothetical protein
VATLPRSRNSEGYRGRIKLAREGLAELRRLDRTKLPETLRVSADLIGWQLDTVVAKSLTSTMPFG